MAGPLVVHLVPYDGVGGVEVAARSLEDGAHGGITFRKHFLFDAAPSGARSPRPYFAVVKELRKQRPDVLIASLWRSYAVLVAMKMARPSLRAVTFLHYPRSVHPLDWLLTRLALRCSDEIWTDSAATIERVPTRLRSRCRVVSMLTEHPPEPDIRPPRPRFIFWGRVHRQKGLDRALKLFAEVHDSHPDATFDIIGPDAGVLRELMDEARGIGGVTFHGPLPKDKIVALARECSFYLQPSRNEGASMSVMEAMQLGLVPVVTPVGEIRNYCGAHNSVIESTYFGFLIGLARLLVNPALYQQTARNAYRTWAERLLYREDVLHNCGRLVASATPPSEQTGELRQHV